MSEAGDFLTFCRRRYRIAPTRVAMLRFHVEGYDGILFLSTVEAATAVVELSWSKSCAVDAEMILSALSIELDMEEGGTL